MENNRDRWVEERLAALRPDSEWQPDTARGLARLRERREEPGRRRQRRGWIVAGVFAAALPIMAFPTTRAFAQRCVSACVEQSNWMRSIFVHGSPISGNVQPEDRRLAPDFVLDDASGNPVRLSDFRGHVVLLNFWATWCAPCSLEIPWFIEFQNTYKESGLTMLGVSLDENGWDAVRPYIDKRRVNYPVMVGNDDVAQLYGATSLPATFIIDRSGRIAVTHIGLCSKGEYEAGIRAVLNEH